MFRHMVAIFRGSSVTYKLLSIPEYLIRHIRPTEDDNHMPKHVGVKFGTH
jgi:hypothetical protein